MGIPILCTVFQFVTKSIVTPWSCKTQHKVSIHRIGTYCNHFEYSQSFCCDIDTLSKITLKQFTINNLNELKPLTWRIICSFWTLPSYGQVTTSQAVHYYVFYERDHFNRMGEFGWGSCSKHSSHFEMKTMGLTLLHRELVKINTRMTFITEWKTPSNLRRVWNTLTFYRGWVKVSVVSIVYRNLWIVASSLHKHPWQAELCSRKQYHRYGSSVSHYMSIQSPKILECVKLMHKYRFWSTLHTFGQLGWWAATDYSWQCHC